MLNARSQPEQSPSTTATKNTDMTSPKRRPFREVRSLSFGGERLRNSNPCISPCPSPEPEFSTPIPRPMSLAIRRTTPQSGPDSPAMARKPRTPLTPLAAPSTPTSGGGTPRRTPKRALDRESEMISSLLTGCIKWDGGKTPTPTESPCLPDFTPEKENCVKGVQLLSLNSPANIRSPVSTRVAPAPKRAKPDFDILTPVNQPKKVRQSSSFNDLIIGSRSLQQALGTGGLTDDEAGVASSDDEHAYVLKKPNPRPFSHWNSQSATFPSMSTPCPVTIFQQKSQSDSAISIIQSMALRDDPTLIGDCSNKYSLPILVGGGKHSDLKEISSETLKALLDGDYQSSIKKFDVVDCRYPYEYAGGHIRGALNLYTELQVSEKFMDNKSALPEGYKSEDRHVIIFHCEFSAQRGPRMCRSLRDWDRNINLSAYPALHYPELYVLNGGYKTFHATCVTHCDPSNYTPMADPKHSEEYKLYRSKSKTELLKTKSSSNLASSRFARQFSLNKLAL